MAHQCGALSVGVGLAQPYVAAVLLGGSTARGHADRYSDIELGVFWHQPPTDAERQAAASAIRGDLVRLYPYDPAEEVWCDDYMFGRAHPDQPKSGVLLEVVHSTTDFLNRIFDAVLQNDDPDALKQNLIAGVVDGVPLHNAELVQRWKDRAAMYPEGLALAVVNRYSMIDHFWRWEMWLARGGNLMMLYQSFTQTEQQLLHLLLGLNRVYYFGFKWIEVVSERLAQQPPDLVRRLRQVYQLAPAEGAHELAALVEETYDLVEHALPQIDIARLLARRGARVTGLEPSDAVYRYTMHREQTEQLGIQYVQADLSTWVPPASTFQTVIANMVLMDIPDYEPALQNCILALEPMGRLIFSILHPCFEEPGSAWKGQGYVAVRDYFTERAIPQLYGAFIHRPLSTYLNSVIRAGCVIDQVLEPQLEPAIAARHDAERYASVPGYLVIAATKPHTATE